MYLKIYKIKTLILLVISLWSFSLVESQEIEVTKLSVNTSISSEIAPMVHDSVLYFVSNRKNSVLKNVLTQDEEHLYRIYSAPLLKNKELGKVTPFKFEKVINLTTGPFALSNDGMFQIVTLNKSTSLKEARLNKKNTLNHLGLFEARRISSDKWGEYSQLSFSFNNSYSFAQPTLSADGQTLIFASNMDGGLGETDLYMSRRTQSGWSEPVNLGAKINSAGSELFPFLHPSGKLYFSSNRYGGQGGFDIYYSIYNDENKEWTTPIPLPSPINSSDDDFSAYIFPEETSGFFASSRDGRDNIYRFDYKIVFCENPIEVEEENYCFTFFEEAAVDDDAASPTMYQWEFSDGTKAMGIEVDHCLPGPGDYEVNLNVIDPITNEQLYNVATYELELRKPQQVYFYLPEKIAANETITLKAELTGFDNPENIQYFWDVEDKETIVGETISHIFRTKGIYRIRCEAYWGDNQSLCSFRTLIVD